MHSITESFVDQQKNLINYDHQCLLYDMSNVSWTECILTTWLEKSQGVWYHMSDKTYDHSFLLNDVPNVSLANLFASLIMYTAMSV